MTQNYITILKRKITYTRNILLRTGLYSDVVIKLLLRKVDDGEFPEIARSIILQKKKVKRPWKMSKDSIRIGLSRR